MERNGDSAISTFLLLLLAVLYPIQFYLPTSAARVNLSVGDIVVASILLLFLLGVVGDYLMPGFLVPVSVLIGVVALSVVVPIVIPGDSSYFSPLFGLFTLIKFVASVAWLVAIYVLLREDTRTKVWRFAVISTTTSTLFATVAVINNFFLHVRRPNGPYNNTNLFAIYLLFNVFLLLMLFFYSDDRSRDLSPRYLLIPPTIGLHLLAVVGTASRAAVVGGGVALAIVLLPEFKKAIRMNAALTALTVCIGIGGVTVILDNTLIVRRFTAAMNGSQTGHRTTMWLAAFRGFLENPIFGIGFGQHRFFVTNPLLPSTPHNTYISFIEETGLLGFTAFGWIVLATLRNSIGLWISERSVQARFMFGFLLAILAFGMFHGIENFRSFWMAIGIIVVTLDFHHLNHLK
jgi:O-antigen ligase